MTGGGHLSAAKYLRMARGLGARSLLEKPFTQEALLAAVESALAGEAKPPAP
jgi:FixJ family two-component response regulator